MIVIDKKACLTDELINEWSEEAEDIYAQAIGLNNAETLKVKLGTEEVLLRFRDCYGTGEPCRFKCIRTRNAIKFTIQQRGLRQNPMDTEESPYFDFLRYMNLNPSYTYHEKQSLNTIRFPIRSGKGRMLFLYSWLRQ